MEFTDILYHTADRVATVTFNRPDYGNAWAEHTTAEVLRALERAAKDDAVGAIVITGAGKHFCAGGDINRFKRLIDTKVFLERVNILRAGRMASAISKCPKPTIAMINGAAAGAGCAVALACDFRVATAKSKMAMSFIKMGLSGDTGAFYYLQRLVGIAKATHLWMTGDLLTGEEAYAAGLVTVLAEEGALEEETRAFAGKLAHGPGFAIAKQKALIAEFFHNDLDAYLDREGQYMEDCSKTEDFAEAVTAFLSKRAPKFTGR
ncbi:MAG: enoyl-CoA hydratase/isomerase family protein [Clostridiales Family XIII bacterium]|jgi:2-(1,2-epoxy-1,2-dihydrophenyl)acetyl-CoA isomerase|nr:enoyl-CoA hydratase/isomerase family protein [Clostridiales Family XIII bacterium]